ncbi:hypothetical protein FUAX_37780 [Fulvitalea axinellae]|uniref:Uncharacterized protein n=2 Tax=Fulvitalea axinellae TaxID=1182444 RepID=A0AAU9CGP8_9BACT|nr:hypothetical protein FUAX_37780 [Fulvitalea axinellae]
MKALVLTVSIMACVLAFGSTAHCQDDKFYEDYMKGISLSPQQNHKVNTIFYDFYSAKEAVLSSSATELTKKREIRTFEKIRDGSLKRVLRYDQFKVFRRNRKEVRKAKKES